MLLGKGCEWIDIDIMKGESCIFEFIEKFVNGKILVLELDDGCILLEFNVIMYYFVVGMFLIFMFFFDFV